ncbi:hypothetical protein ACFL0A_01860 [Patescibacteria group bacterium]
MKREELLIKQYEVLSERKLHFGRLFWQIPTVFMGICILIANIFKEFEPLILWWFIVITGLLLILMGYIAHRLRTNEDNYDLLMERIEKELKKKVGPSFQVVPLSKKFGAKFWTTVSFVFLGFVLLIIGLINLIKI